MLSKKELKQLRKEIILNSVFLKDYNNSLYIKEKTACDFFNSYMEYLQELSDSKELDDIFKHDNFNNLWNYYLLLCHDGYDPLCKDDFIAYFNDCVFSGCVIYDIKLDYDYSVIAASYVSRGVNGNFNSDKVTINKLQYDRKKEGYYFIKNHRRYYINDFMKTNY